MSILETVNTFCTGAVCRSS